MSFEVDVTKLLLAAFAVGGWAMLTTIQLQQVRRDVHELSTTFKKLLVELAAKGVTVPDDTHGRHRHT